MSDPPVFTLNVPPHDPFYALGKLNEAVQALGTYPGNIRAQLFEAAKALIPISPEEIPDGDLRRMLIGIKDDLTYLQAERAEGNLTATLRKTSDEDLNRIATRIRDLYQRLDEMLHRR